MVWKINFSEIAAKQMKKLDKSISKKIIDYFEKKIAVQEDPTVFGKPLLNDMSGLWRYRVEDYRIVCEIKNQELVVLVLRVAHRKRVYDE